MLWGSSYAGAVVMSFLYNSDAANLVSAVILEAPVLDVGEMAELWLRVSRVPAPITGPFRRLISVSAGVSWSEISYLARAGELRAPILIFHGDADRAVPIETSRRLAALRPDLVTLVELANVGHGGTWNASPADHERRILDFLGEEQGG